MTPLDVLLSTVFQAEIEAISHACQYALANSKELDINYIKILSDSEAAIEALPDKISETNLTMKGADFCNDSSS